MPDKRAALKPARSRPRVKPTALRPADKPVSPAARSRRPAPRGRSANYAVFSAITVFFLALGLLTWLNRVPLWLLVLYAAASLLTLAVYAHDKSAAKSGRRRTPEVNLHLLELLCGWPGALLAQQLFRHKTRKQPFQAIFWGATVLNSLALSLFLYRLEAIG